jgi:hypothetical protein
MEQSNHTNNHNNNSSYLPPSIFGVYHTELISDLRGDTTNDKSARGRKICPITFAELRTDNTIKIGNTLFSTNGLLGLIKAHAHVWNALNTNSYYAKAELITDINNPLTNMPFSYKEACLICSMIFHKNPYNPLYWSDNEL